MIKRYGRASKREIFPGRAVAHSTVEIRKDKITHHTHPKAAESSSCVKSQAKRYFCEDLKIANKQGATTQPPDNHNKIATRSGREISGTNQQREIVTASQISKTNKYHEEHGGLTFTLLSPPRKPIGHGSTRGKSSGRR